MTLSDLITRVRSYTRDTTGTLFTASDVRDFINEAIDKLRQIKELENIKHLSNDSDVIVLLPSQYHYMTAVYGASRCFSQDEQHYQAQTYMDEFMGLFSLVELGIKEGTISIYDENGQIIRDTHEPDSVENVYFS